MVETTNNNQKHVMAINDLGTPGSKTGKGIGNLPGENKDASSAATENTYPAKGGVQPVVGYK